MSREKLWEIGRAATWKKDEGEGRVGKETVSINAFSLFLRARRVDKVTRSPEINWGPSGLFREDGIHTFLALNKDI